MGAANISVPAGLDFGAIYRTAEALDADVELLAEVLPSVEAAIVASFSGDGEGEECGGGY
jgi:hypothetical protein